MADVPPKPSPEPIGYEPPDLERAASAIPTTIELKEETKHDSRHDPYAALRYRDYLLLSIGWMVSVIGNQLFATALAWEIFDRTRNPLALGWVAGVQVIPLILLALPAGQWADTFDRRRIIQVTLVLCAICSVVMAYLSYRKDLMPAMYATLFVSSCFAVIGRPARSALMPLVVPTHVFSNAVTWNSSFFQLAVMIGPALAGFIIHFSNVRVAYVLDAVCELLFGVLMIFVRTRPRPETPARKRGFSELLAGIHFVHRNKIILATITLDLFAVLLGGAVYLLPVYAADILHVGALGFGWLRAADAIGALTMAMIIAHMPPMKKAGRAMLLAVAGFGAVTIIFGFSRWYWLSFIAVMLIGALDNISVVVRHTLVQVLTPDNMRGRVSAVNNIFIGASNELGGLESGVTAAMFGPVISVVGGGIGTILAVCWVAFMWPQVRKFGSLRDARPEPEDEAQRGFEVIQKPGSA